jgi:hypothetical protein
LCKEEEELGQVLNTQVWEALVREEEEEAERRILADSSHKTMKTPTITSSYKNLRSLSLRERALEKEELGLGFL